MTRFAFTTHDSPAGIARGAVVVIGAILVVAGLAFACVYPRANATVGMTDSSSAGPGAGRGEAPDGLPTLTEAQATTLPGTSWRSAEAPESTGVEFGADGSLLVYTPCNNISADYAITGGRLEVGELRSTRMACPPEASRVERELAEFFAANPRVFLGADATLWLTADGRSLQFLSGQL